MNRRRHILFACAAVPAAAGFAWGSLSWTDAVIWHGAAVQPAVYLAVRCALLASSLACVLGGAMASVAALPRALARTACAAAAIAAALLLAEFAFTFVARSHGVGYSMAGRIWFERHFHPIDAQGCRDASGEPAAGKKIVWVLGDSFTAGQGVADLADRYTERLAAARPDLHVVNVGYCGADTGEELRRLRARPGAPDLLLLQHYPNDIDGAAARCGHAPPPFTPYQDLRSTKLRFLVRGSCLANFAYWQFAHGDVAAYESFLAAIHGDPAVARAHADELVAVHEWARERGVALAVLALPLMEDLEWSRRANAPVLELFRSRGVPTIDAAEVLGDLTRAQRVVNSHDAHASPIVHQRLAELLAQRLPR